MRCPDPLCTGVHDHNRPYSEWCPLTVATFLRAHRDADARYRGTAKDMTRRARAASAAKIDRLTKSSGLV